MILVIRARRYVFERMREAIEELDALDSADADLLRRRLEGDVGEILEDVDDPHRVARSRATSMRDYAATYATLDAAALAVYRLINPDGDRYVLVAPRNPAINPGATVMCRSWASVAFDVTLGDCEPDVELHLCRGLELHDQDV